MLILSYAMALSLSLCTTYPIERCIGEPWPSSIASSNITGIIHNQHTNINLYNNYYNNNNITGALPSAKLEQFFSDGYCIIKNVCSAKTTGRVSRLAAYWRRYSGSSVASNSLGYSANRLELSGPISADSDVLALYYASDLFHAAQLLIGQGDVVPPTYGGVSLSLPSLLADSDASDSESDSDSDAGEGATATATGGGNYGYLGSSTAGAGESEESSGAGVKVKTRQHRKKRSDLKEGGGGFTGPQSRSNGGAATSAVGNLLDLDAPPASASSSSASANARARARAEAHVHGKSWVLEGFSQSDNSYQHSPYTLLVGVALDDIDLNEGPFYAHPGSQTLLQVSLTLKESISLYCWLLV